MTPSSFNLDFETTSKCPIDYGAYRYAADPSTRILLFAIAQDDEAPVIWRIDEPDSPESCKALYLFRMAVKTGAPIRAFNVGFEAAICKYVLTPQLGIPAPALEQWRCTQAMCRRAAIPASLAKAAEFLKLGDQKNPIGKALIGVFSDQNKIVDLLPPKGGLKDKEWKTLKRPSASPILEDEVPWDWSFAIPGSERMTVREGWDAFIAYCRQDVVVERRVCAKLAKYELTGTELEGFQFDLRMNDLGTPVNVPALRNAQEIVDTQCGFLTREFERLTGLQPGQTAAVLKWLKGHGYPGDNLQAATMEEHLGHTAMSREGHRALEIRSQLSFAAVKKVPAMLNTVCPDGRMRGLFTWYGASATGRWTSTGPQLQNAKKPSIKDPDAAYKDICEDPDIDLIEALYGNPYEVVASCVRNFVQPAEGQIIDVDFSNIESRVAAWLAGQDDLLDLYRQDRDAYKELAAQVFNVRVENVTKEQRFVGKVGNLSLVFQTGAKTFHETCAAWGMPIEKKVACHTVRTFRETYDQFPKTWRRYEAAALRAMEEPGRWHEASEFVSFAYSRSAPFPRLLMKLPSGRYLTYPLPEVNRTTKVHKDYETGERREWESADLSFYGHLRNSALWGRVTTYSGSLFQSCLAAGTKVITREGVKSIELVSVNDEVWDGVEFVRCDGAVFQGFKECKMSNGLIATPDHLFMVDNSWVSWSNLSHDEITSQSTKLARKTIREFGSRGADAANALHALEGEMRLRNGESGGRIGIGEIVETQQDDMLWVEMPIQRGQEQTGPRAVVSPDLRGPRLDDVPLLPSEERQFPSLRREGDQGVQSVAQSGKVLQGHAPELPERISSRSGECPRELHSEERPVGQHTSKCAQQGGDLIHGHPVGSDDRQGRIGKIRNRVHDASLPNRPERETGRDVQETRLHQVVYDILNCGPRHRFAVITDQGIMIAHNCVQATARDILQHGCLLVEKAGFKVFSVIHDQTLAHEGDVDRFRDLICTHPEWLPKTFPIAATGELAPYYRKD